MADIGDGDNEFFDISTLSETERRRLRRRQRILDNQGARLQKILSSDPNSPKEVDVKLKTDGSSASKPEPLSRSNDSLSELPKGVDSIDGASSSKIANVKAVAENSNSNDTSVQFPRNEIPENVEREPSITASRQELSREQVPAREPAAVEETRMGLQSDGTTILPRISNFGGRVLICLLGLFLSIFNAKRYVITFISWEVAFYFMNGLPPLPPPNMAMVLAAVMGLRESQLVRVKKLLHFSNCVLIDFSLFLVFTLLPHIVRNLTSS